MSISPPNESPEQPHSKKKHKTQMDEHLDALPGPVRAALQFLLLDLIDPRDSFSQILRKIVVTAGACMFIHPVSYIGYFAYLISQGAPVNGPACLIVACCFSMLSWSGIYLIARQLRDVPDFLMDLWLLGTNIAFTLLILSMPQYPATTCVFASAILTILCNSPRRGLHLTWCALLYLLKEYNDATAGSGYEGLVPGARYGPLAESLINHMSGFFIAFTVMLALWVQTKEHIRNVEGSQAAVTAARVMAKQLAHYDTVAVQQTISDELIKGQIDSELLDAFSGIADNLERYRPHLPNWMVHVTRTPTDPDLESISGMSNVSKGTRKSEVTSADVGVTHATDSSSSAPTPLETNIVGGLIGSRHASALRLSPRNKASSIHRTRIVLARVRVAAAVSTEPQMNTGATDLLLGEILALADATQASLHSFICDDVVLSWNATHRVAQPEVKAARLLAKLKLVCTSRAGISAHLRVTAAAISTEGISRFAGPPGGQCTLHVSIPELSCTSLWALSELAASHDAIVVDGVIARASTHDVVSREIEAFSIAGPNKAAMIARTPVMSPFDDPLGRSPGDGAPLGSIADSTLPTSLTIAAEVLCERAHSLDEWMYVLDKADKEVKTDSSVTKALRLALAEKPEEALALLDSLDPERLTPSLLLTRLRKRIASMQPRDGRTAFALEVNRSI